jgi:hypothetical protein
MELINDEWCVTQECNNCGAELVITASDLFIRKSRFFELIKSRCSECQAVIPVRRGLVPLDIVCDLQTRFLLAHA